MKTYNRTIDTTCSFQKKTRILCALVSPKPSRSDYSIILRVIFFYRLHGGFKSWLFLNRKIFDVNENFIFLPSPDRFYPGTVGEGEEK